MDIMTKEERSIRMSKIRSKWTKPEKKIHNFLKGRKVKHKMHPDLPGNPDIVINDKKAVYVHGCFWHKCKRCYREPKSRKDYWVPKIEKNVVRDKANSRMLSKEGYGVITIWEHEANNDLDKVLRKITK